MKTATASAVLAVALCAAPCARGFVVSAPRTSSALLRPSRAVVVGAAHPSCPARAGRRGSAGLVQPLSMVSATFGEKINTDRIVMDKTAREVLQEQYPEALAKNPGFVEEVGHGETKSFTEDELRKRLEVAHVFVKMANLVMLSRGMNIFSEDFKFYSPGTGRLDRARYLKLTKTMDVAFSTFKTYPTDFVAYKDGTVSFRHTFRAVHDGYLNVGEKTYPPTMTRVVSDVDLCTISFDDTGVIRSYTNGLMVELVYAIEDPEAVEEIEQIKKRITTQQAKMVSLEGQESSIAYSKCKADIDTMRMDMEALLEKVNSAPNTGGLGGYPGLFAAVGAEFPKDLRKLEGTEAYGDIEGMRLASFSFPAEVKEYDAFDFDTFKEMK